MGSKKEDKYIKFEVIERKYNIIMTTGREYCVYKYFRNPDQMERGMGFSLLDCRHVQCEVSEQIINPKHIERYEFNDRKTGVINTLKVVESEYRTYYTGADFEVYKREE